VIARHVVAAPIRVFALATAPASNSWFARVDVVNGRPIEW
jgi:hypothetical protein